MKKPHAATNECPHWPVAEANAIGAILLHLGRWQKEVAPNVATPAAIAVLLWIIENRGGPGNIRTLYKTSSRNISVDALRDALAQFEARGLLKRIPAGDRRLVIFQPSSKLNGFIGELSDDLRRRMQAAD